MENLQNLISLVFTALPLHSYFIIGLMLLIGALILQAMMEDIYMTTSQEFEEFNKVQRRPAKKRFLKRSIRFLLVCLSVVFVFAGVLVCSFFDAFAIAGRASVAYVRKYSWKH